MRQFNFLETCIYIHCFENNCKEEIKNIKNMIQYIKNNYVSRIIVPKYYLNKL